MEGKGLSQCSQKPNIDPYMYELNPVYLFKPCFRKAHFKLPFQLNSRLSSEHLFSDVPTKLFKGIPSFLMNPNRPRQWPQ
jgi:hypothetical protein